MRNVLLIAWTVLIEAIRRREVYAIVTISVLLIGAVATTKFFNLEGLGKFYREIALQVMSIATGLTVIVIGARQFPREFENRTIYPLMAKPISRAAFILGKLLGVLAAGCFCLFLFMLVFLCGSWYLKTTIHPLIFVQFLYLQVLALLILTSLSFMLSLLTNFDASITLGAILYVTASVFLNALTFIYPFSSGVGKGLLKFLLFAVPQLSLFNLSEKVVHEEAWGAVPWDTVGLLTIYGAFYTLVFLGITYLLFRRKAL